MLGNLHLGSRAGEPACRSDERIPRLTSSLLLTTCEGCRSSRLFNSRLRSWLLRQLRSAAAENREDLAVAHAS